MKKVFFTLIASMMLFSSCITEGFGQYVVTTASAVAVETAISSFEYTFYDYFFNYPVVYRSGIPYYQIWSVDHWFYHPVPHERLGFIRHYDTPRLFTQNDALPKGMMGYKEQPRMMNRSYHFGEPNRLMGNRPQMGINNNKDKMEIQNQNQKSNQVKQDINQTNKQIQNQRNMSQRFQQNQIIQRNNQMRSGQINLPQRSSSRVTSPMRTGSGRR